MTKPKPKPAPPKTAAPPDPRIVRAERALTAALALHARMQLLLEDAGRALREEPSTTNMVKRLFNYWAELWRRRYTDAYVFTGVRDGAAFKRLLRELPGEEIARRMKAYLQHDDEFLTEKKHPLQMFVSTINRYGNSEAVEQRPAPVGCKHDPPCQDDVQHTRKHLAEMRVPR